MEENTKKKFSVAARLKSFTYAYKGLKLFFSTQHNAWIHSTAAILAILAGFYFQISIHEWLVIVAMITLVFVTEIINTSIEFLTDFVSPAYNEKAGKVKDLAAAAVLVSAVSAVITAIIIFGPKIHLG